MARPAVSKTPFSQRLTEARKGLGYSERSKFAQFLGMNSETLGGYERGDSMPDQQFLALYKQRFSVNLNWLFTGEGEMFASNGEGALDAKKGAGDKSDWLPLPFFAAEAAAGFGRIALDELPAGSVAFERAFLRSLGASPDNCFVMKSRGDSMQPTIPDDSILVIDQSQTEKIEHGCLYVFRVADVLLVKRARWHMDGKLELSSDNPAYQPEFLDQTHADTLSVLGRVVYFCRVP